MAIGLVLTALCTLSVFVLARRSPGHAMGVLLLVGANIGYIRAHYATSLTMFLFDIGCVSFYAGALLSPQMRARLHNIGGALPHWFFWLCAWPALLLLVPTQPFLVRLVGFRDAIFYLPFLLVGYVLTPEDRRQLAKWLAVIVLLALGEAWLEVHFGLAALFPPIPVDFLILAAHDVHVGHHLTYRIPAFFVAAAVYGEFCVLSVPFLVAAVVDKQRSAKMRLLALLALTASLLGVLYCASRSDFLIMAGLLFTALLVARMPVHFKVMLALLALAGGLLMLRTPRFQRSLTLQNTAADQRRVQFSVNQSFIALLEKYPMGNGLGGGGSNMPSFLQHAVRHRVTLENEYARIMLEQGIPGLILWCAFLLYFFLRGQPFKVRREKAANTLAYACCAALILQAMLGLGLYETTPSAAFLFLLMGWLLQGGSARIFEGQEAWTGPERVMQVAGR